MERELTETKEQRAEALNSLSTLCDFFQNRVLKGPSDEALREFNRATKEWVSVTYKELGEKVKNWQRAFADLGLNRGDRVAMLLPNGVNAVCFDQAAMANSLVPVPLHAIDTPASSAFILQDSGASVLVTDKKSKWEKIQEAGFDLSAIKKVIITEELTEASELIQGLKDWLKGAPKDIPLPEQPTVDDLACIVYTSGTTGRPKGVMLTIKTSQATSVQLSLMLSRRSATYSFRSFRFLICLKERQVTTWRWQQVRQLYLTALSNTLQKTSRLRSPMF